MTEARSAEQVAHTDEVGGIVQWMELMANVMLRLNPVKPADPAVWEMLLQADGLRRELQRSIGVEPTRLSDPHGRVYYPPEAKTEEE